MNMTYHKEHLSDRAAMVAIRAMLAVQPRMILEPASRSAYDGLIETTPAAEDVDFEPDTIGGVSGWWCRPKHRADSCAVLYLHGGGYVMGTAHAYRNFCSQIATRAQAAVFIVDYALAPERPFPEALDNAVVVLKGLTAAAYSKVILAGDSAGGGLVLSLLQEVARASAQDSVQTPLAAVLISPWVDLALTGDSLESHAAADPILSRESLAHATAQYLGTHDSRDPKASPLYGDFSGMPPVLIHVGEDEVLLDDARRTADSIVAAGGTVRLGVWQGMTHVFCSNLLLDASKEALDDIGAFIREKLHV